MPTLLLLNGPPGVGKTTLARRVASSSASSPLALVVDVDSLRTAMGGWRDDERSMTLARDLALALCRTHLAAGHDVIVPQYVGRLPFIEALAVVSGAVGGSAFVEVVLTADPAVCASRFRARGRAVDDHPATSVPDDLVESVVADAIARLAEVRAARPATVVIDASDADTAAALVLRRVRSGLGRGSA